MRTDRKRPRPATRAFAAFLSAYAFVWGLMTLGVTASFKLGLSFHDAEHLFVILGLAALLALFLWAFATPRPWRAWAVLLGCGLLMSSAASMLQAALLRAHAP